MKNHLLPGTLLLNGKYRIVRFIKSGGFGCTYEAETAYFKDRVAIKEFFIEDFCNRDEHSAQVTVGTQSKKGLVERLKAKFIEEAMALHALQHPGIVHVSDLFEENGTAYYVMDYINGRSLDEIVRREGAFSEAEALGYVRQVCDALQYVHSLNRLHLDLKPGNLMLTEEGKVILIDFGTAKQYDEYNGENTSTLLGYTPGYAPPEQMNTKVVEFYPATDIYALGATLYKLLTGVTPLTANERSSGEELDPLPETVSRPTCNAIEQAMLLKKRDRPQDVDAFLALLDDGPQTVEEKEVSDEEDEKTILFDKDDKDEKDEKDEGNEQEAAPDPVFEPAVVEQPKRKKSRRILWTLAGIAAVCIGAFAALRCLGGVSLPSGFHSGHAYVDLGLPSGTKWATCNVGAFIPSGSGDVSTWTDVDAVMKEWGGDWRLPTENDFEELLDEDNCTWAWTTIGFRKGYKVTSRKNGNSIFLPVFDNDSDTFEQGLYWSSTRSGRNLADGLYFHSYIKYVHSYYYSSELAVRPVFN